MMLLYVGKLMDQKYSREEISGATDKVNGLILLLHQMTVQLLLPRWSQLLQRKLSLYQNIKRFDAKIKILASSV